MTTATTFAPRAAAPTLRPNATALRIAAAMAMAFLGLIATSLAVAFPMVVTLVESGRITITPEDLAASRAVADAVWVLVVVALLHLLAAAGMLSTSRWLTAVAGTVAGAALGLGLAAAAELWRSGPGTEDGIVIVSVVAAIYLFATAVALGRLSAAR